MGLKFCRCLVQAKDHRHVPGAQDDLFLAGDKATAISAIQAFVEGLMGLDIKLPILKTLQVVTDTQRTQVALEQVIACTDKLPLCCLQL